MSHVERFASRRLAAVLVVVAVVAVVAAQATLRAGPRQLSAYSDSPEDLGRFRSLAAELGHDTASVVGRSFPATDGRGPPTLYVAVGLDRRPTEAEADALRRFVGNGGAALVATDDAAGNAYGAPFGVQFDGVGILSRPPGEPRATRQVRVSAELEDRNFDLVTLSPTALSVPERAAVAVEALVVAESPATSFLDLDANGTVDDADRPGPFVVAFLVTDPSGGRIAFVGDEEAFTDDLLARGENEEFLRALVSILLPDPGRVVFDESLHGHPAQAAIEPVALAAVASREPMPAVALVVAAVGAGALVALRSGRSPAPAHRFDAGPPGAFSAGAASAAPRIGALLAECVRRREDLTQDEIEAMPRERLAALAGDEALARCLEGSCEERDIPRLIERLRRMEARP
ncbi:MAG: DUF4350 domain-containing protein [Methanobacteriota archaeon]